MEWELRVELKNILDKLEEIKILLEENNKRNVVRVNRAGIVKPFRVRPMKVRSRF